MRRPLWKAVVVLALAGAVVSLIGLAVRQNGGPPRRFAAFGASIPGTVYLPEEDPPEPVPVVVLAHGYSGDQAGLSNMARRLASSGYAVITFDVRGHGRNNEPFTGDLRDDLDAVLDGLESVADIDRDRVALAGHSMGAYLAVEHASFDDRVAATIGVAGGAEEVNGPRRPPNLLLLVAERTDEDHNNALDLAADLNDGPVEEDRTYGSFSDGDALRVERVEGTSTVDIIFSVGTARRMVAWLDQAFDVERTGPPPLRDGRFFPFAAIYAVSLGILLVALGQLVGRLAPVGVAPGSGDAPLRRIGWLTLALVAPLPITAVVTPLAFIPLDVADGFASELVLAGAALLLAWRLGHLTLPPLLTGWRRTGPAVAVGFLGLYLLQIPFGPLVHDMVPTTKRLVIGIGLAVVLLVFTLPFEALVRRGSVRRATFTAAGARLLILIVLQAGAATGALPGFLTLILPVVALGFVVFELFAFGVYSTSRNVLVIAVVGAASMGWTLAISMPIRI